MLIESLSNTLLKKKKTIILANRAEKQFYTLYNIS